MKPNKHKSGDGHYRFFADSGLPEPQAASRNRLTAVALMGCIWSLGLLEMMEK